MLKTVYLPFNYLVHLTLIGRLSLVVKAYKITKLSISTPGSVINLDMVDRLSVLNSNTDYIMACRK